MILIISPKNLYAAKRLVKEAIGIRQKAEVRDVRDLVNVGFRVNVSKYDCLYIRSPYLKSSAKYILQVIKLAKKFKTAGKKVVDANIAKGNLGQGKWKDYLALKKANVSIPKTVIARPSESKAEAILKPVKIASSPAKALTSRNDRHSYILKWIYGMKGKGTFLIKSETDIKKIPDYIPRKELMQQEFIVADYEYKVICVGYKSLPVVLKFGMNKLLRPDFKNYKVIKLPVPVIPSASDLSAIALATAEESLNQKKGILHPSAAFGTQDDDVSKVVSLAQKASKVLGRELSKVDILESEGKFYVLEVNRFPGLKSFEELAKFNVAREFIAYLQK